MAKQFWLLITLCANVLTLSRDSESNFSQTQWGCRYGTSRCYANNDVKFWPKTMAKQFWSLIFLCVTLSTLSFYSKSNTLTNPMGCHGGTNLRYGNNDCRSYPKTIAKHVWPPIPLCVTVSRLSHDSALNSPPTQLVAMVAQKDVISIMTSYLVQNHFQAIFTPYFSLYHRFNDVPWPITQFSTNSLCCHSAQAVVVAKTTSCFVQNPFPSSFDRIFRVCRRFNTVTWLSIAFSTNRMGCHGGTSRHYGNNDSLLWPKSMVKHF